MRNVKLYDQDDHQFVLLNESEPGEENGIRSNQYLVKQGNAGILLDPGGFGVMSRVLAEMLRYINPDQVKGLVLTHQDPDIVAGLITWLEVTPANAFISRVWTRFLPHYGIRDISRFVAIPDNGMLFDIAEDFKVDILPAHFLHSEGNVNVYDPVAKILFSGDIGAAALPVDKSYTYVDNFEAHRPYIEWFHRRYMTANKAARLWVKRMRALDIKIMAPQHGPVYRGEAVSAFFNWFEKLPCGVDLIGDDGSYHWDDIL